MYYIDYHTHSQLSPDSDAPLAHMAQAAVEAGLSELCVTDHYDLLDQDGKPTPAFDWAPATAQYLAVREQFRGKLTLKLGLELGTGYLDDTVVRTAPTELDFVIGSLHNRSLSSGGLDFFYGEYQDPAVCYQALDDYFAQMEVLAPLDCYDVLGHIIYPLRYMQPQCREALDLGRYMERIRELLRVAIAGGRGMEVNTYRGKTIEDWRPVLAHFKDLGGEALTVGSDAHAPESMALGVREAYALLQEMGFRYITVYEGRKPRFVKL